MRIHSIFLLFVLLFTACLQTPQPVDSGIEGAVTIGPMCPVMQEDVPCPDQPYQATLTVLTTSGEKVTQFQTDENGRFQIELAPGDYVLHPESPNTLPFAADISFTVIERKFTLLEISYDSGIR
ncbi:MAG: carboxypeptidase regulatory-like domain-containing protein [Anaerolineales bacterium]|nr:carboxypeptidase regulatory-like domain-containing protein [Anaerolineales bacterium]